MKLSRQQFEHWFTNHLAIYHHSLITDCTGKVIANLTVQSNHEYESKITQALWEAFKAGIMGISASPVTDLNTYRNQVHKANYVWWHDKDGNPIERNKGELLCLIHSEVSEAMEGERKDLMDDKLPHRKMAEVELVDAMIRIFDYAGAHGYDLQGAFEEKMAYNAKREDHTHAHRATKHGNKF